MLQRNREWNRQWQSVVAALSESTYLLTYGALAAATAGLGTEPGAGTPRVQCLTCKGKPGAGTPLAQSTRGRSSRKNAVRKFYTIGRSPSVMRRASGQIECKLPRKPRVC